MTKRMSGYDAFLKLTDIREEFLDEAYLPTLFPAVTPPPKKKLLAPLWAFFGNHAVAAAVGGVLALGVITVVIAMTPLNPFRDPPPVTEPPTEESSDPAETPPVTDEETEPETETEEIGEPYELVYTSGGDGSCKVSDIVVNPRYREKFTLTIPATSPDGERVMAVENPCGFGYGNLPYLLLPEDYEKLLYRVRTHFGKDSMTAWRFENYYVFKSAEKSSTENLKNDILTAFPWAAVTDFYMLDPALIEEVEGANLSDWIAEAAPDYVAYEAEKRLFDLATAHGYTLTWRGEPFDTRLERDERRFVESIVLENGIESIGDKAFCYAGATSLTLPENLTHIGAEAFSDCRALSQITWPAEGILKQIGEKAFFGCEELNALTLTGNGLEMGRYAFAYSGFTTVTLGAGVSTVGELAFFGCNKLETLHIGQDVTYIGPDALREAGSGSYGPGVQITFDENCRLTELSEQAFWTSLRDTILPTSITRINYWVFYGGEISYAGTIAEWEAIEKDEAWCCEPITVHCADGDVTFDPK